MAIKRLLTIREDRFYIVDLWNEVGEPLLLWNEFNDWEEAVTAMFRCLCKHAGDRYIVISGPDALKHKLGIWGHKFSYNVHYKDSKPWIDVPKYRYPPNCITMEQKYRFRWKTHWTKR